MGGYLAYNGPNGGPQSVGAIVLDAAELASGFLVVVVNDGPELTITTLGALAQFFGAGAAVTGLTATGSTRATALSLPGAICVFTDVPPGTGAVIPADAAVGSVWDVWNRGANNLLLYPLAAAAIENLAANGAATIIPGGRTTFIVESATQVYAG